MRSPTLSRRSRDLALALALAGGALVQLALAPGAAPPTAWIWVSATTLPLAARGRWPVAAGLGVQVVFVVGTPYVAVPHLLGQGIAVFLVATYVAALGARSWAASAWCGLASLSLLGLQGVLDPQYGAAGAVVANAVYVAMTWAVAAAVRTQNDRSRRSVSWAQSAVLASAEDARRAAEQERARLARELHDMLGHAISAMVLRARGAVHEHGIDPDRSLEALRDVEAVGTQALADVRVLLELDDADDADGVDAHPRHPLPDLDDLDDLLESSRRSGMAIDLEVLGVPRPVSNGLGLVVYRVVQESLTNAMRHSGSPGASVLLTWGTDDLVVEVRDDGPGDPSPGGGHGLFGLRERVTSLGGTIAAGPRPSGGFEVRAQIPAGRSR